MLGFSFGAFLVYLFALCFMVMGGFIGLVKSGHPAFLAPILLGLFFFYLCWEATVGKDIDPPGPRGKSGI